ncbi:kinase-like domain-containing protein [Penicillium alfredii]|uniref:Kinase-like domain-containing protein n=1 Tax=Penicillium alfredii TaxID=1506179 RepID=A0A9W9EGV6_9EURO|nr:kinase-like domain-containing protein [Penicillium alfredii]KAJ5081529.1 kinase-like domain-containing protein [Penicillium alfredii]
MEKLKASGAVPEVYKALKLPLGPCFEGSLVVTEKLDKSAMGMLQEYATKPFNRLIMMQQWVKGLAYAHEKGIAHRDANPGNLMKVFHRDEWKIIDWDHAYDFGRKPGKTLIIYNHLHYKLQ